MKLKNITLPRLLSLSCSNSKWVTKSILIGGGSKKQIFRMKISQKHSRNRVIDTVFCRPKTCTGTVPVQLVPVPYRYKNILPEKNRKEKNELYRYCTGTRRNVSCTGTVPVQKVQKPTVRLKNTDSGQKHQNTPKPILRL